VGKPLVYATSKNFMDYIGINSSAQLPQLKDISNVDIVLPTNGSEAMPENEGVLVVTEEGALQHVGE